MIAQADDTLPWLLFGGGVVIALCLVIGVVLYSRKAPATREFSFEQLIILVIVAVVFTPCTALIVAFLMTPAGPFRSGGTPPRRRPPPVMSRKRRQQIAAAEAEHMASVPQFVQCLRCGETNNAGLAACWKCGQSFVPEPVIVSAPPMIVAAPPRIVSDAGDATPIMPTPAAPDLGENQIKVRCKACGKRFSGTVAQLSSLKACPRCKAAPFDAETVSP